MIKLTFLVFVFVLAPLFADDVDWKLTFLQKTRESIRVLDLMVSCYFAPLEKDIAPTVTKLWTDHHGAMLEYIRDAKLSYVNGSNPNGECIEILDVNKDVIQVSKEDCPRQSARAMLRGIIRELFVKVAGADDETSRWGAFALEEGWEKNRGDVPPFKLVGNYTLTSTSGSITATISRNAHGRYNIDIDTLTNFNRDQVSFKNLEKESGGEWKADAKNPSKVYMRWGDVVERTLYGTERIEVTFTAPDRVLLVYRDKLIEYEHSTEIRSARDAVLRAKTTRDYHYFGSKNP